MSLANIKSNLKFILISLLLTLKIIAQPNPILFDHYGLEAGFLTREASDIVTTPNGMVWISSNDGLVRYDSKRFKFYTHIEGDKNSLTNNYCQALATDKRGHIWVQSDDNLDIFNPLTEQFIHVKVKDSLNNDIPVFPRRFAYDNGLDVMWIATTKGLFYSMQGAPNLTNISKLSSNKLLATSTIGAMVLEGSKYLWVTVENQIIKLNTINGNTEIFVLPAKVDGFLNNKKEVHFLSAWMDDNKTIWLGTWLKGLVEFNTKTATFHQYCFRDYTKEENTISEIAQTKLPGQDQILWLTTSGYGLATFNIQSKKFECYNTKIANDANGIKGSTYGLYADGKNGMWIGSASGLHRYDYHKQLFNTIDFSSIEKGIEFLPVEVMAIEKSKNNQDKVLWFYIPYKGGYLYDFAQQKVKSLPPKIARIFKMPAEVLCFYIDVENILWISTVGDGLTGYDIGNYSIIFRETKPFGEQKKWIWSFYEDRQHRLWLGTVNGLYVMDSSRKTVAAVDPVNSSLDRSEHSKFIVGITEDDRGNIWFTADGTDKIKACIAQFNPYTKSVHYAYREAQQQKLNHNPVELGSIVFNGKDKLFASFNGQGMAWFKSDQQEAELHFLTMSNGLASNRINGLIADETGNIWCSTSFGFSCYRDREKVFTNYTYTAYGLDNTQGPAMYLSAQSGRVYVGQTNAIRYFNAGVANAAPGEKELLFTEIKVLNKPFNPKGKLIENGDEIQLNHTQDMISIEFALLSYTNSASNTYSWLLEGWDKDWNTSSGNIAAYVNLEPGNYTLLVKAANSQGEWTTKPIRLALKIAPPFYKTWWFITLSILVLLGIVYWLMQLRIRRLKEKFQLRNKIAADLHDEIGSTLTSISILSNVSQQATKQQPQQAKVMLEQISAQSKTIQQSMSDIVWSIRPDNEMVGDLVTRMREYAAQTLEQMGIDATLMVEDELATKILPMQHRKELLLIYKEAINNISKHAEASRVSVSLNNSNRKISLTIQDNGK